MPNACFPRSLMLARRCWGQASEDDIRKEGVVVAPLHPPAGLRMGPLSCGSDRSREGCLQRPLSRFRLPQRRSAESRGQLFCRRSLGRRAAPGATRSEPRASGRLGRETHPSAPIHGTARLRHGSAQCLPLAKISSSYGGYWRK